MSARFLVLANGNFDMSKFMRRHVLLALGTIISAQTTANLAFIVSPASAAEIRSYSLMWAAAPGFSLMDGTPAPVYSDPYNLDSRPVFDLTMQQPAVAPLPPKRPSNLLQENSVLYAPAPPQPTQVATQRQVSRPAQSGALQHGRTERQFLHASRRD
jgi:hypothetical protein